MTRAQKRRKRFKAQYHRQQFDGQTIVKEFENGTEIIISRGTRMNFESYHKSDPLKHGQRLDAHAQAVYELGIAGVKDPTDKLVRFYQRFKRVNGGNSGVAINQLRSAIRKGKLIV